MRHPDDDTHLATPSEAVAEWARNIGDQFPDRAWLLHDWDVWVANPHYVGPPVDHPEMEIPDESELGPVNEDQGPRRDYEVGGGEFDPGADYTNDDIPF